MAGQELASNPWAYAALVGFFVWLIPLWHSIRSGSILAAIEVLALLALGVAAPVLVLVAGKDIGEFGSAFGAFGALQAAGGSALLWLGALLIALAADLGREFRRAERRRNIAGPGFVEPGRQYEPRR